MNKCKFLVVLVALFMPMWMTMASAADIRQSMDRWEFGASAGVGFYVGQEDPTGSGQYSRVMSYDAVGFGDKSTLGWPGIETFGFMLGYRFDTRWHVKVQATRQRLCYAEYRKMADKPLIDDPATRNIYYNAMWHVDVMAEYNLLSLGNVMMAKQGLYNVVPYIGFGFGVTAYNKESTLRKVYNYDGPMNNFGSKGAIYTCYPRVGYKQEYDNKQNLSWKPAETACALYIPVAFGVKWRVNDNVQLKGTFQYQLYFASNKERTSLSGNLEGGSFSKVNLDIPDNKNTLPGRPTFDDMSQHVVGYSHDCLFSLTAIFNLGKWYEDRLITY